MMLRILAAILLFGDLLSHGPDTRFRQTRLIECNGCYDRFESMNAWPISVTYNGTPVTSTTEHFGGYPVIYASFFIDDNKKLLFAFTGSNFGFVEGPHDYWGFSGNLNRQQ